MLAAVMLPVEEVCANDCIYVPVQACVSGNKTNHCDTSRDECWEAYCIANPAICGVIC